MKKFSLGICVFCFLVQCKAQIITEPPHDHLVKEDYMTMLIDSLAVAKGDVDTAKIIRYAALLINEFQALGLLDRASSYLNIARQYAETYSNPVFFADLCHRAGMLIPAFCEMKRTRQCDLLLDSSAYWYHQAIKRGLELEQYQIAGWGYRGLLVNAIHYDTRESSQDSIPFYYNKAVELATCTQDVELMINCHKQYGHYLNKIGDLPRLDSLLIAQSGRWDKMTPFQKYEFRKLFHNYVAKVNHLDTLIVLRDLMESFYLDRIASRHKKELYVKDQQFEVSKTKTVLEATTSQLEITNQVLVVSFIVLIVFAVVVAYLFFLFRKNKKLSQRNELLLKEQNHRVKNNLQLISSLLSLQSQQLSSSDAQDALNESQSRINSIALLHRMLYEGEHIGQIETKTYLQSLVEEIQYNAGRKMEIELNLPGALELKVEKVTSLGLIVNELLTNSIKHVESHKVLQVYLSFIVNNGKLHLTYKDNGRGVVPEEWMSSESFGNQLIQIQSRQLKGEFEISVMNGFRYDLRISA